MVDSPRHVVLGTSGHIDHGKTSLVKALTGVDTDRLEEEKRRGITIELGFAPWHLRPGLEASIVDVPGHERLVRTMVAGVAGIDAALLVVAADDGVMPQTREHLDILSLLAVPAGVLVVSKCDLVDDDLLSLVDEELREACRGTVLAAAPLVHVSSRTGAGLDALRDHVVKLASGTRVRPARGPAFLPLDRVFTMVGHGTVVTGTLLRGRLQVGDSLEALGEHATPLAGLKVRALQALGQERKEVVAGMRAAVNVTGRAVAQLRRGMTLAPEGAFQPVDQCVAWLEMLPRGAALCAQRVTAHLGTAEREVDLLPLGCRQIEPGASAGALLRFRTPVAAFAGQRLVLRRPGVHGQATVAGGAVLDPEPPRGKRCVSVAASLVASLRGPAEQRLLALAREARSAGVDAHMIERRLQPGEGEAAREALERRGELVRVSGVRPVWVSREHCEALAARIVDLVVKHHDEAPLTAGLPEVEIESRLPPPERPTAALAVGRAVTAGLVVRCNGVLSVPGRRSPADAVTVRELDAVRQTYREAGLTPPSDPEAMAALRLRPRRFKDLMRVLVGGGEIVRVAEELHYDAAALGALTERVVVALREEPGMTASRFKSVAGGLSRKYAIPLLEYLDQRQVTVRIGDERRLHPTRL